MGRKKHLTLERLEEMKGRLEEYLGWYVSPKVPVTMIAEEYLENYWSVKYKVRITPLPLDMIGFACEDNETILLNEKKLDMLKDMGVLIMVITHEVGHCKGLTHEHHLMKPNLEDYIKESD